MIITALIYELLILYQKERVGIRLSETGNPAKFHF